MLPPEYAAGFAESYVALLNRSLPFIATEEAGEVTKVVLGDALQAYRQVSGHPSRVYGHADGRGPFFRATFPDFEFVPVQAKPYDLFIQGGSFSLLLESEMDPWRKKVIEDYGKLLVEECAGEHPVRVIVVRNTRRDRAWRDNHVLSPLIDSWRTQQSFVIVEICWVSGTTAQHAVARARAHANGATVYNSEPDDWAYRLTTRIDPSELQLPTGQSVTIRRSFSPSYDWQR